MHVAAALYQLDQIIDTATFRTTPAGYATTASSSPRSTGPTARLDAATARPKRSM